MPPSVVPPAAHTNGASHTPPLFAAEVLQSLSSPF
jgi:hypothetical protein